MDYFYIEYLHADGYWWYIDYYTDIYSGPVQAVVPAEAHDGKLSFRLHFVSDGFGSDVFWWPTNGAVVIDDLTISDDTGIVDHQDFEAEAVGAQATLDGHWLAATGGYTSANDGVGLLAELTLLPAVPNPFNPQTTIRFDLSSEMTVNLCVYDVGGRLVDVLLNDEVGSAGLNEVVWRGRDAARPTSCRRGPTSTASRPEGTVETKRMTLLK